MTTTIRLQREPFDVAAEVERMTRGRTDVGAVVTFTGLCRADENGEPIAALTLEHYPGMAEAEIGRHVEEAQARWPLLGVTVIHRYGRMTPGDVIVLVATASSHREAPISALDHSADVTDWYAFVSYDHPDRVTMILNVDGFLEPSNGPNYFPFDPNVLYEMKVDNNRDGKEDITFQFRFNTEIRLPGVFTGLVGGIAGIPPITALDGPGSEGLSLRQSYTVVMRRGNQRIDLTK